MCCSDARFNRLFRALNANLSGTIALEDFGKLIFPDLSMSQLQAIVEDDAAAMLDEKDLKPGDTAEVCEDLDQVADISADQRVGVRAADPTSDDEA